MNQQYVHGYTDRENMRLVEGLTKRIVTAMIEGVRELAIKVGIAEQNMFAQRIRDLYRTLQADSVFCYTLRKGIGNK